MCGWTDDASDIDRYHVEIYYMNIGGTGLLEETRSPVHTEDIRPPHNNLRFTCRTSGVYSIQLTVYDRANNTARARQLFSYDGESKMTSTVQLLCFSHEFAHHTMYFEYIRTHMFLLKPV